MTTHALSDGEINSIKDMLEDWTAALAARDWARWQSYWLEDGVLMPPGHALVVGHRDLVAFASENFGNVRSFAFSDWTAVGLDDLAVVTNTIRIDAGGIGSAEPPAFFHQMMLLRKQESAWRVYKVIFNGSEPA